MYLTIFKSYVLVLVFCFIFILFGLTKSNYYGVNITNKQTSHNVNVLGHQTDDLYMSGASYYSDDDGATLIVTGAGDDLVFGIYTQTPCKIINITVETDAVPDPSTFFSMRLIDEASGLIVLEPIHHARMGFRQLREFNFDSSDIFLYPEILAEMHWIHGGGTDTEVVVHYELQAKIDEIYG